ncbi:MAG: phenylacetate--CoA ligase family protein [Verrucomicrobia bacterium]|nr:MAG: phenylacetate--CoA ligase family protein [Verrucomicrobiota bacterium]
MAESVHPDRAAIEAGQLEQLRSLVAELIPANKFYTHKLQDAGVGFDIASLEDLSARFPFTTKQELVADQLAAPPFGTNLTYPLNRYTRFHQTSGTSGAPLRWLDTPESWDWMLESWTEIFRVAGVTAGDRVYFAFSFGPFLGFWLAFESAAKLGCLCIPGGGMSSEARVKAIVDCGATVICCTPTYAIRLGEVAALASKPAGASRVKTIIVAGEPGGSIPATRKHIEELWPGARVFDHHGMTEVGPVTYECPARPGVLHVIESAYFAEVIDPACGKPATTGELVLTTLGRTGSPLLRYRTGDLVKCGVRNAECGCGRHELALDGGILGRVDDMVIVRGVNVYPSAVEEILRGLKDVAEYRVHVGQRQSLAELRVELEPSDLCRDAKKLQTEAQQALESAFNLRVPVELVSPGSLPRFEMKARRWTKDIQ